MDCPYCGAHNADDAKRCRRCGASFVAARQRASRPERTSARQVSSSAGEGRRPTVSSQTEIRRQDTAPRADGSVQGAYHGQFSRHDVTTHSKKKPPRLLIVALVVLAVLACAFLLLRFVFSGRYSDANDNVTLAAALSADNDRLENLLAKNGYTNTGGGNWSKDDGASLAVGTGCYLLLDDFSGSSDESSASPEIPQPEDRDWATIHVSGYRDLDKALSAQGLKINASQRFSDVFGSGDCIVALCTCNRTTYIVFGGFDDDDMAFLACRTSSLSDAFDGVFDDGVEPYDGIIGSIEDAG